MGAESMGIVTVQLSLTDDKVCKNYLCGTCPHVVFQNTVRPVCSSASPARQLGRLELERATRPLLPTERHLVVALHGPPARAQLPLATRRLTTLLSLLLSPHRSPRSP